ncbi:hypothetical protein [Wolbachia endosymbiont of Folsomia candida]|uniref:hypothetical protein n=1 Tax=Wolbachia endosymbiont of Folsomia candida TaxID=169402 RepID=UPI000A3F9782|nr:hypothetical protein [Wolbachia endosymbiont of Folsomia candida]
MEPIFPEYAFGSVNLPCWQNNVIRRFSQHQKYRVLFWEFGPTVFEYLCKQKGLNAKELQQKNENRENLEKECLELLEAFGEMKAHWWWPWSSKIKDIMMTEPQEKRAKDYDRYSLFWRVVLGFFTNVIVHQWRIVQYGYFFNYQQLTKGVQRMDTAKKMAIGLATGATVAAITAAAGVATAYSYLRNGANTANALVPTDRFGNLIRAIALSHNFDGDANMTLNKALEQFKLKGILTSLDSSLQDVEEGKKSKEKHGEYAKERIKDFQKLSLRYHPDKQIVAADDIQKTITEIKKALNSVHDYVMKETHPNKTYGHIYRLFGELPVSLINSGKELYKIINVAASSKLFYLALWEEGMLMQERNRYLREAKEHYVEPLENMLSLVKKILSSKEPMQEAKNCIDSMNKIKGSFEKYNEKYQKSYEEMWVQNLKELNQECKSAEGLKIIKPEVEKLVKEAKEQYQILKSNKAGKVKPDGIFVQPMLEYTNLINMYYKFAVKLCENIESCFPTRRNVRFNDDLFKQQKFALGEEETEFTEISKKYMRELSYQELSQFSNLMVNYYYHNQSEKELDEKINKYYIRYQSNVYTKKEIGNVIVFVLNHLATLLNEELKPLETFFEKDRRRKAEYSAELDQLEQRAEQEAQRAEHTGRISQIFSKKTRGFDDDLYDIVIDNQVRIVEAVVKHVMQHNSSSPEQLLSSIIDEIKHNKTQVLRDETVNPELINMGINRLLHEESSTTLSDVNVSQGASTSRSAGVGRR